MVLGQAVLRDDSEAITVEVTIPDEAAPVTLTFRRGFVGRLPLREIGSSATFEGRQVVSVEFSGWNGDEPHYRVRMDPAGPG